MVRSESVQVSGAIHLKPCSRLLYFSISFHISEALRHCYICYKTPRNRRVCAMMKMVLMLSDKEEDGLLFAVVLPFRPVDVAIIG